MKERRPCQVCGLVKTAAVHVWEHEYDPEPRPAWGSQGRSLSPRSQRPNRIQRREEVQEARRSRREAVRVCEAPAYGIQSPCGAAGTPEAGLEASHVIGLGMGGGREYGEVRMLCRKHHRELDTDRQTFREAGLSKRAPRPDKVVPRPSEITFDRPKRRKIRAPFAE